MRKLTAEEFDTRVDFFDKMAQSSWLTKIHLRLLEKTGSWKGKAILDVGCGTGRLLFRGADKSSFVAGIDISAAMIARAQLLAEEQYFEQSPYFQVADAEKLPFYNESFDFVLSTCVIFLLPEPKRAIQEMMRVLKKGGVIGLINPSTYLSEERAKELIRQWALNEEEATFLLQWGRIADRRHRFDEERLSAIIKEVGYETIQHEFFQDNIALITFAHKEK